MGWDISTGIPGLRLNCWLLLISVTAHNHPAVRFTDDFGYSVVEPAWIRTKFNADILKSRFGNLDFENRCTWADPELFVMPAFNELCGGVPFNESTQEDLLGPVFSSGGIELENAEVYLLDGTRLGLLKNIRKLQHTRVRNRTSEQETQEFRRLCIR